MNRIKMFALAGMLAALTFPARAGDIGSMLRIFEQDKTKLIRHWARGDAPAAYGWTVKDLVLDQVTLMGMGFPADDPRLITFLARDKQFSVRGMHDLPLFAYRVFEHEVYRRSGFRPDPRRLFEQQAIRVIGVMEAGQ